MKKYLTALVLSLAAASTAFAADVTGVWVSKESSASLTPGTLTLTKDGKASLAPSGYEPLNGKYKADAKFIDIEIQDKGKASLAYVLKGNQLTVEYENGSVQHFTKSDTPAPKKGSKK